MELDHLSTPSPRVLNKDILVNTRVCEKLIPVESVIGVEQINLSQTLRETMDEGS
jgi:hypothetical protein